MSNEKRAKYVPRQKSGSLEFHQEPISITFIHLKAKKNFRVNKVQSVKKLYETSRSG